MKKFLLSALLAVSTVASLWAVTDGVKYDRVNGIGIKNVWIQDRVHTPNEWGNQPYCNTNARTAVLSDGYIYIARSNANTIIQGTDTLTQSVVYKVNAANGELVKELPLTLDGAIYGGATLSANTVGVDNFGHLYISPFSSIVSTQHTIYMLDGDTGELTWIADLDKADRMIRQLEGINKENSHLNGFKVKSISKRYGDIGRLMHVEVFKKEIGPNRDETVSFKETKNDFTATVTDHKLSKEATVKGKVNFIDPSNKRMLFSMPYEVSSKFEHNYSTVEGSLEACSEQTLQGLKQKPVPFPTDESLINDAKQNLINLIYQMIQ